jgi:hypothetical protein
MFPYGYDCGMNREEPIDTGRQNARMKKEHFLKEFPKKFKQFPEEHFFVVLLVVIVLTIIVFLALLSSMVLFFISSSENSYKFLPPLVLSAAALIAILAYWRDHNKTDLENKRSRSELFLRLASDGLTAVFDLLKDKNNDRIIWVRAARTLLEAKKLSKEVELPEYQLAYRIHERQIRNDLYLVLRTYDEKSHTFQPLPPQFFFGTPRWEVGESLDDLAKETSQKFEAHTASIDKIIPEPPLGPLSEESVCVIFDFLDDPEVFKDPLKEVKLWSGDWHVFGPSVGARRYIHHRLNKYAVGGKLFDRKNEDDSSETEET